MYLSSASSRLLLHDTKTWDLKKSFGSSDGMLRDISWSDDSKYMLQVNSTGSIEILSAADQDVKSLQHLPVKDSWSASFHRDGHNNIAFGTKNGIVKIWDVKNKTITKSFPPPAQPSCVNILSYNAKNTSLAATMANGDTVIYGLVSNIIVANVQLHCSKSISAMKFHHEKRSILGLATDEGHIILRDITTNKNKVFFEKVHAAPVSDFSFSPINKDVLISSGYDKIVQVFDTKLKNVVTTVRTTYPLTCVAINTDNQVALGTHNGLVLIYDLRDLTNPFKVLKGHEKAIAKLSFQPPHKKLLTTDLSLSEGVEEDLAKASSPVRTRTSDMFMFNHSLLNTAGDTTRNGDNRVDSFLDMLNKTDNFDEDADKQVELEEKNDIEKRIPNIPMSKVSTPISTGAAENFHPSPLILNRIEVQRENNRDSLANNVLDNDRFEELKHFIKLNLSYIYDNNTNTFLSIMMALTKQKLHVEKELEILKQQVQIVQENQTALMEANRKLSQQLDQLKCENFK